MSETAKHREFFTPWCIGDGIDLGYGGDPITPTAITMDQPTGERYSNVGKHPQNLSGDARDLRWFRGGMLDYVFSSHLIEDFEDTSAVLVEWIRVLKRGGYLCLLFPDEQKYKKHCAATRQPYNMHHAHADMGLLKISGLLTELGMEIVASAEFPPYNCAIVARRGFR